MNKIVQRKLAPSSLEIMENTEARKINVVRECVGFTHLSKNPFQVKGKLQHLEIDDTTKEKESLRLDPKARESLDIEKEKTTVSCLPSDSNNSNFTQTSKDMKKKTILYISQYSEEMIRDFGGLAELKKLICLSKCRVPHVKLPLTKHKTLVLDLDETLIHTVFMEDGHCSGTIDGIPLTIGDSPTFSAKVRVKIRPYAKEFLASLSVFYDIIVLLIYILP